jgi:hypothetical protein
VGHDVGRHEAGELLGELPGHRDRKQNVRSGVRRGRDAAPVATRPTVPSAADRVLQMRVDPTIVDLDGR